MRNYTHITFHLLENKGKITNFKRQITNLKVNDTVITLSFDLEKVFSK